MRWVVVIAVILAIGGVVPGLGIPGALPVHAAEPIARLVWGGGEIEAAIRRAGLTIWGMYLFASPVWSLSLIPAWSLAGRIAPSARKRTTLALWLGFAALIGLVLWTLLMTSGYADPAATRRGF